MTTYPLVNCQKPWRAFHYGTIQMAQKLYCAPGITFSLIFILHIRPFVHNDTSMHAKFQKIEV